jgi:dCTP deaminase
MDQEAFYPYQGKYQGQRDATGSQVYLDSENRQKQRQD